MKLLREFGFSSVMHDTINGRYCIKTSSLDFLSSQSTKKVVKESYCKNRFMWIDAVNADVPGFDFFQGIIFNKYRADELTSQNRLCEIEYELTHSLMDISQYYHDLVTYNVEPEKALKKAETLCLLRVIEAVWDSENLRLLYQAVQRQKVRGEIKCDNAREFYYQVKWFVRMGIFQGVLMSESRW